MNNPVWIPLWVAVVGAVAVIVPSLLSFLTGVRNGKKLEASRMEVAAVKDIAQRTSAQVEQIQSGVFQAGYLRGTLDERKKDSDLGTLD